LQTQFGNELHIERFCAELRARQRNRGESLQSLYLDIVRMTTLAHPSGDANLIQHVAREAFINALNDDELQIKVIAKQPATVEEDLNTALRLEAYEAALGIFEAPPAEASKGQAATNSKTVNAIRSSVSATGRQLQIEMQALKQEFEDYKNQASSGDPPTPRSSPRKPASSHPAQVPSESSRQGATAGQVKGRGKGGGRGRIQCSICDKFGHLDKDCMHRQRYSPPPPKEEEVEIKSIRSSSARGLAKARFKEKRSHVYVRYLFST